MIALFLAVITLSNVDPDAVKANPVVLTKTADATGLLGLNKPLAGLGDDSSVSFCASAVPAFGAPAFGTPMLGAPMLGAPLFDESNSLNQTLAQPQCAGDRTGFDSAFGPQNFGGEFAPLEAAMPWVNLRSQAPLVFLETPVRTSAIPSVPAVHLSGITAASGGFAFHGPAESGEGIRGLHPVRDEVHAPSPVQPVSPQRH